MPRISGRGLYTLKANSVLYNKDIVPSFKLMKHGGTRVRHREFIQNIFASGTATNGVGGFLTKTFRINPAFAGTFPWLASIANQFSEYRMHGLVFQFVSTSGDALNSVNTALGKVILATQYNVYEPDFTSPQFMENTEYSVSGKPSNSIMHGVECGKFMNVNEILYTDDNTSSDDQRFEDMGKFTIASVGVQGDGVQLGELWVSYDVELLKPRQIASSLLCDEYVIPQVSATNSAVIADDGNPLGVTGAYTNIYTRPNDFTPQSNFGIQIYAPTGAPAGTSVVEIPSYYSGPVMAFLTYQYNATLTSTLTLPSMIANVTNHVSVNPCFPHQNGPSTGVVFSASEWAPGATVALGISGILRMHAVISFTVNSGGSFTIGGSNNLAQDGANPAGTCHLTGGSLRVLALPPCMQYSAAYNHPYHV